MKRCGAMLLILAGLLPAGWLAATRADAAALASLDMSAAAAGVGNAFTATADDPTAMSYNPAGIAWQPGFGMFFSGAKRFDNQSVKQTTALGTPANTEKPTSLAGLYATWMPTGNDLGLGLAFDLPYSTRSNWGNAFGGAASKTTMDIWHLAGDVVYAINSNLAIAGGGDWYTGKGDVNSVTTTFHGKARSGGFGGHVSALWRPLPEWAFGAMLKSGATVKLNGTASGAVAGNASVKVKLPDVFRLGVSHVFDDRLRLEVDASWSRWSTQKNLNVVGTTSELNPLNLRDSFSVMSGLTWYWRENAVLRCGYAFDQAATRDGGLTARLADANMHRISLGAGADLLDMHLDLAYVYAFAAKRTINNGGAYDGSWRNRQQTLALSIGKRF